MSLPLYRRLLGPRFGLLPTRVRELHDLGAPSVSPSVWAGKASVERGRSGLSRLAAWITGLPSEGRDQALSVTFTPVGVQELWKRQFGVAVFKSRQYAKKGFLCERSGPATFVFTPVASPEGLELRLDGFRVLGLPLPRLLHPGVRTWEWQREGVYHFQVEVRLALVGLIIRYEGWLMRQP